MSKRAFATAFLSPLRQIASRSVQQSSRRTLIIPTTYRPSLNSASRTTARLALPSAYVPTATAQSKIGSDSLDLMPKISTHPALASIQVRNGPRNTTNRMTHLKRKRRVGFLARLRSRTGRRILKRRMLKGRSRLSQ